MELLEKRELKNKAMSMSMDNIEVEHINEIDDLCNLWPTFKKLDMNNYGHLFLSCYLHKLLKFK